MISIYVILITFSISLTLSTRLKYRATVKENVELYYTITSLDKMLNVNYQQSIEFLNSNSPYTTYFLVDGQKIRTSRLIDREEFCRIKLCENSQCYPCEIHMDFVLKENHQPKDIISLILTIEDVNEFRPQFLDSSINDQYIQLNISEGVPVGHVLPIPSATDQDGEDDELIYYLDNRNKTIPFELISFGSNQIALNITEALDREIKDFYELKLTVQDRENLTTTLFIHININDINDNVPIFNQQTPYIINISENLLPSLRKSLLRIHAYDNDSNENGHVIYKFSSQVSELIRQTFELNSETGDLYLLQSLDYEQYKEYRIPITAQDSGPVSVPVYNLIIVNIEDENDNKPILNIRISDYFQYINNTIYISEETPINTLIMHLLVEDFDTNLNGKIQCSIESTDKRKFDIIHTVNNMFSIYTSDLFDRELKSTYSIRIIVQDSGLKIQHQTIRDFNLIITDINDSSPTFTQTIYQLKLYEETLYNHSIIQFYAYDNDLNENSRIAYELLSYEYQHLFQLNSTTGHLYLKTKLDREYQSEYNLTIRAKDHGLYPKQLYTDVLCFIEILDINEYKPNFIENKYLFNNINETILINTSIGFIKAIDRDNNQLIYSISSNNFRINSKTGELFVNQQLDYDKNQSCETFIGIVKDSYDFNDTCQIIVCLQPVNEYSPEIDENFRFISINIDNTSSIDVNASDKDRSPSSYLSFYFEKKTSKCNLTFSSNGTIFFNDKSSCFGIIDLFITINDNDKYPISKKTNQTIRLMISSNKKSLNYKHLIKLIICLIILLLIKILICFIFYLLFKQRKQKKQNKTKFHSIKTQNTFPENHCLLTDGIVDLTKIHTQSDTSSSYNDSCYGSSEMNVYHHQLANKLSEKILLSTDDKYIILCTDQQHNSCLDEINSSSLSSSPSSVIKNMNLIAKYQMNKRSGLTQQYATELNSSKQNIDVHQNELEVKPLTTTFNCRNMVQLNEYYL